MAYNRINYYKRIIAIQEIVITKQALGIPNTRIYRDYIEMRFLIAESTFKKYLGVPAKRELKKLEAAMKEKDEANKKPYTGEGEKQSHVVQGDEGSELDDTKKPIHPHSGNIPISERIKI